MNVVDCAEGAGARGVGVVMIGPVTVHCTTSRYSHWTTSRTRRHAINMSFRS